MIVTLCELLIVPVVAVNVPLDCPALIDADAGTVTNALELLSAIVAPVAVDLFNESVQVLVALLARPVGVHTSRFNCAGATALRVKLCVLPFRPAVICELVSALIALTDAVNHAELWPALIVTLAGTLTAAALDDNVTLTPADGTFAAPTTHVVVPGAFTEAGVQLRLVTVAGTVTLTGELTETPFRDAVTFTDWLLDTVPEVTVKLALDCPAAIVTLGGALNGAVVLSVTVVDATAAEVSTAAQVVDAELWMVDGEQSRLASCGGGERFNVTLYFAEPLPAETVAV